MLVLFETPAGFAIFKLLDEKKLRQSDDLFKDFSSVEAARKVVKLKSFDKFEDTTEALSSAASLVEGKMSKGLKKLLKKVFAKDAHEKLAVADAKLGQAIKSKLEIDCVADSAVSELMRCIRSQLDELMPAVEDKDMKAMSLGLAHSLSRYKLKFSPDKIDTMIVQAVSLLDDLDKELNNYMMRAREWYGWHFPELGKVITDNVAYIRTILVMGQRENAKNADLSDVLPEDVEARVKESAEISMGTEISDMDMLNIRHLCEQVIEIQEYRGQLYEYLKNRMVAIAPNLTAVVGDLIGARLISHAGSLINLAKHPASTVQILGAEKALFKALKTKHDTPKYGLIYHAQVVGQASAALKGKASRMLAAKAALACRTDALDDSGSTENKGVLGIEQRAKVESRIRMLESGHSYKISGTGRQSAKFDKYEPKAEVQQYNIAADNTMKKSKKRKLDDGDDAEKKTVKAEPDAPAEKKKKKKKNKKAADEEVEASPQNKKAKVIEDASPKKMKKVGADEEVTPAKKKKMEEANGGKDVSFNGADLSAKKNKKKKKNKAAAENLVKTS